MADQKPLPKCPSGCEVATTPIGMQYIRRKPREAGQYFRVKHHVYGQDCIKAKTAEEAVAVFAKGVSPLHASNKERLAEFAATCRVSSFNQPAPGKE